MPHPLAAKICPLPFYHGAIRPNGQVYPCCYFRPSEIPLSLTVKEDHWQQHEFLEQLRNDMLQGQHIAGCSKCDIDERVMGASKRLDHLASVVEVTGRAFEPPKEPSLRHIDLALSNVCNNRCRMCGPELSTNWYPDARQLGMPISHGVMDNGDYLNRADFSQLVSAKIIGGEPLLEQAMLKQMLTKCTRSKLDLHIVTNGTCRPDSELVELIKECKSIEWIISVDAFGGLNDFLRKGSKWTMVADNIAWFDQNFDQVKINSVVSVYNVNYLELLPQYLAEHTPRVELEYTMIDGPDWMELKHLPVAVKTQMIRRIKASTEASVVKIKDLIINQMMQPGDVRVFLDEDQKLNQLRREHWKQWNPELAAMLGIDQE